MEYHADDEQDGRNRSRFFPLIIICRKHHMN